MKDFLCILLMLAGIGIGLKTNAVSVKEYTKNGTSLLDVENRFYKITIAPANGGKIIEWFDKLAKINMVSSLSPGSEGCKDGGMLDDRNELSFQPYSSKILINTPKRVLIHLKAKKAEVLGVEKELEFTDGSPVVKAVYHYYNHSHYAIEGFRLGIKNFFVPGGKSAVDSETDRYFLPTTHGVRRFRARTFKEVNNFPMQELRTKLKTAVAAPWTAFLDTRKKQGLGVFFADNSYFGWYAWKYMVQRPTFEWCFRELPAGHSRKTEFGLVQIDGFNNLSFLSERQMCDTQWRNNKLSTTIRALQPFSGAVLVTKVRQVAGVWEKTLKSCKISKLALLEKREWNWPLTLPGTGLYEITQELRYNGKKVEKWHECVVVGNARFEALYEMPQLPVAEENIIPGWKGAPQLEIKLDKDSVADGFMLSAFGNRKLETLKRIDVVMGKNEYYSLPIRYQPLEKSGGKVKIGLQNTDQFPVKVFFEKSKEIPSMGYGRKTSKLLYPYPSEGKILRDGVKIWLRLGNGCLKPGGNKFTLTVKRENAAKKLPVYVKVLNVPMPHRPLISLEAEGYPINFPGCGFKKRISGMLDVWLKNMGTHGIDFFQELGSLRGKPNYTMNLPRSSIYSQLKIPGTGKSLAADIKSRPDFYRAGKHLPPIDFSSMDYYIDRGIANGLVRFKMAHYDISQPVPLIKHIYKEANRYLKSKGFQDKDIFVKIMDEQPPEKYPAMVATAEWLKKECGFRPFSTFSNIFESEEELKILNPYFDMYQGGFTSRAVLEKRLKDGVIDKDDIISLYTGTGAMIKSYSHMAGYGWQAFALGHNLFHNHEYLRGGNKRCSANIVYIGKDGKPVDSPAFEGLRDGMTCANYGALFRQWQDILKNDQKAQPLLNKLDKKMQQIIGFGQGILQIQTNNVGGIKSERIKSANINQYSKARVELLQVMAELGKYVAGKSDMYALATWNDMIILSSEFRPEIVAVKPAEKAAAKTFEQALRLGCSLSRIDYYKRQNGMKVSFVMRKPSVKQPYTYQIKVKSPKHLEISGTELGLVRGATNLVKSMNIRGNW